MTTTILHLVGLQEVWGSEHEGSSGGHSLWLSEQSDRRPNSWWTLDDHDSNPADEDTSFPEKQRHLLSQTVVLLRIWWFIFGFWCPSLSWQLQAACVLSLQDLLCLQAQWQWQSCAHSYQYINVAAPITDWWDQKDSQDFYTKTYEQAVFQQPAWILRQLYCIDELY